MSARTTGSPATHDAITKHLQDERNRQQAAARRRRRRIAATWLVGLMLFVGVVTAGLISTRRTSSASTTEAAPDFTLTSTTGQRVTLSALRGTPVLLYFNEGAGCGSCTAQMAELEKNSELAKAGVRVLPIVMNTAAQITPDLAAYSVSTPYLLDDGTVSAAYKALGTGMHEGLPGHGFVFIDSNGIQRWRGDYPSMWLAPTELMKNLRSYL